MFLNDTTRARKTACLTPLLDNDKVHFVEGSFFDQADYKRAWEIASSGLRGGDVDLILFLSSESSAFSTSSSSNEHSDYDTDAISGLRAFRAESKRALRVPMVHAWKSASRFPDPWITFLNVPSGKSAYVTTLRHLEWHQCCPSESSREGRASSTKILRNFDSLEYEAKPACTWGEMRTRC